MTYQLSTITREILDSYEQIGGINHLRGPNLPSRAGIQTIIADIESLIFPGFKTEEALDVENIGFITGETINRLARNLATEIMRSLCFQRRARGEVHCPHHAGSQQLNHCREIGDSRAVELLAKIPQIRQAVRLDVEAAFQGDPAAQSAEEVILSYPGVEAILIHRFAHEVWKLGIPLIPRMMSESMHGKTGIDIHPGATIGRHFFIDHATGVVIGETTVIGDRVKIYQGVTLGALSVKKESANEKRHPTIEDDVTIYAGATILGGDTVIGRGTVVGGNVWLTDSVPPGSKVYNQAADPVVHRRTRQALRGVDTERITAPPAAANDYQI